MPVFCACANAIDVILLLSKCSCFYVAFTHRPLRVIQFLLAYAVSLLLLCVLLLLLVPSFIAGNLQKKQQLQQQQQQHHVQQHQQFSDFGVNASCQSSLGVLDMAPLGDASVEPMAMDSDELVSTLTVSAV